MKKKEEPAIQELPPPVITKATELLVQEEVIKQLSKILNNDVAKTYLLGNLLNHALLPKQSYPMYSCNSCDSSKTTRDKDLIGGIITPKPIQADWVYFDNAYKKFIDGGGQNPKDFICTSSPCCDRVLCINCVKALIEGFLQISPNDKKEW